jgi:hypothetical protein
VEAMVKDVIETGAVGELALKGSTGMIGGI